ncbi:hypothetical protein [Sphaerisporangium fuscum]|uniref:hypothetical protein n=1 Tax=Sphaerisporangium fuscum TaxID=2835868 RepID=UPI001BDDAD4F|nr:hypothetical protein [Sphaerisporangium fuscum]
MSNLCGKAFISSRRACLIAAGAAVLAIGGAAMPAAAAADPVPVPSTEHHQLAWPSGIAYLPARVNLLPTVSGTWVNTGLEVTLPQAGTYALDLNVRTRLTGLPPVNVYIVGRLWDVTSGAALPNSERILNQVYDNTLLAAGAVGGNVTAPISELVTVSGPTTIRLEVQRNDNTGVANAADVWTDANGRTSFRFDRVS